MQILQDEKHRAFLREAREKLGEVPEEACFDLAPLIAGAPNRRFAGGKQRKEMGELRHGAPRQHRQRCRVERAQEGKQRVGEQGVDDRAGDAGMELRFLDSSLVVTRIEPGSTRNTRLAAVPSGSSQ